MSKLLSVGADIFHQITFDVFQRLVKPLSYVFFIFIFFNFPLGKYVYLFFFNKDFLFHNLFSELVWPLLFNRPGVAGAVLQSPPSLID